MNNIEIEIRPCDYLNPGFGYKVKVTINGVLLTDLWYPRITDGTPRTENEPTEIRVGLVDVRAADDIVIDYDFERNGYRIRMATIHDWHPDDKECDEGFKEVGFIPAYIDEKEST
jgi:hypothetical protein